MLENHSVNLHNRDTNFVKYSFRDKVNHLCSSSRSRTENGPGLLDTGANISNDERPPFITTVTRGRFLPSKFDLLFTFSSRPRPVGHITKHQCSLWGGPKNKKTQPRGAHDYYNVMWDPHICRGSTSAQPLDNKEKLPRIDDPTTSAETKVRKKRTADFGKRSYSTKARQFTPSPVENRFHSLVQTEQFLEDLSLRVENEESDASVQTDPIPLDPNPSTKIKSSLCKSGLDQSTQVFPGDLFDFDLEIQPFLESFVGKILEQAIIEAMEEEESMLFLEQRNLFQEKRRQEERELKIMKEQHERITAEKEHLKRQLKNYDHIRLESDADVGYQTHQEGVSDLSTATGSPGTAYSTSYILELLPSVLSSLRQEGFLNDNPEEGFSSLFAPWPLRNRENSSVEECDPSFIEENPSESLELEDLKGNENGDGVSSLHSVKNDK